MEYPIFTWKTADGSTADDLHFHFWRTPHVPEHAHEYYELFLITEGRVLHAFNGEEEILEKGMLCLIKPGDAHRFRAYEGESTVHFNLSFTPALAETLCLCVNRDFLSSIMSSEGLLCYKLQKHEYNYFKESIRRADLTVMHRNERGAYSLMRTLAVNFLFYIHKAMKKSEEAMHPEWFEAFLEVLNTPENFSRPLSDLYSLSGYSQTRLNSYFRRYMGTTLVAYLTERKINYACNLLSTTNYTVIGIALSSGFHNLGHFNKVFKTITGETPTAYRKKRLAPPMSF